MNDGTPPDSWTGHPALRDVAKRFAKTLPQELEALEVALRLGQHSHLKDQAHRLKGASGALGLSHLRERFQALEEAPSPETLAACHQASDALHFLREG